MTNKVHSVNDKTVIKRFRQRVIPYNDILDVLRSDGSAFLETSQEAPLRRTTIWRAAKKLGAKIGKTVKYERVIVRTQGQPEGLEGYLFSVEGEKS